MGAISGPGLYGAVRGVMDARKEGMEEDAFATDQEIRKERLGQEKDLAPLRRRALEVGIGDAEHQAARRPIVEKQQDELAGLNIDIAKLNKEEREKVYAEARVAREKRDKLHNGLSQFHASGNPEHVAKALADIYPQFKDMKASRDADGNIVAEGPGGQPHVFKGKKWDDGSAMSPDEEFSMFAYNALDPVKSLEKKWEHAQKVDIEGVKTERALGVARISADGRATAAETRAGAERGRRVTSDIRLGNTMMNNALKTTSIPGHFQNVYSSEDDAKLSRFMTERMGKYIREDDMEPEKAVNKAIEEVRTAFASTKKLAVDAATKLAAAKVDVRDRESLAAAVKAGNADAKAFVGALGKIKADLGEDAAKYLYDQVPSGKKK